MNLRIENSVLFKESEEIETFFHPKTTLDICNNKLVMTLQTIGGSDYYGPIQVCYSDDKGINWSKPEAIPSLGWQDSEQTGIVEGVCDVVPDYHAKTRKTLAIGHNVYYKGNRFYDTSGYFSKDDKSPLQRFAVYSVLDSDGGWSPRQRIYFEEFNNCSSFVCGCTQKIFLPDGKIIIPFSIGYSGRTDRMCCSLLCDFDGEEIKPLKRGNILENPVKRGLLEPSICQFENIHYMTIRTEDDCGYVTVSDDGLNWNQIKPWQWDNSDKLIMSSTQQHWLTLGGKLYLVYTRKTESNAKVVRWRSPMFIAEVDPDNLCLKSETEQMVFPMRGNPDNVARMGNFMPITLSQNEAIITVGDLLPRLDYSGKVLNYSGKVLMARLFAD